MRWLLILWKRWQRQCALDELSMHQSSFEVGPLYLANVMQHVVSLERDIERLSRPRQQHARAVGAFQ